MTQALSRRSPLDFGLPLAFHIPRADLQDWRGMARYELLHRIAALCDRAGLAYAEVPSQPEMTRPYRAEFDGRLNIVMDGWVRGKGWLNAAIAYLPGFWHLDPEGVLANRSGPAPQFRPAEVDLEPAAAFFHDLRRRFLMRRVSRYRQPKEVTQDLPKGCIAVFLQGDIPIKSGQCQLDGHEIILAACRGAGGRRVVVKPHPFAPDASGVSAAIAALEGADFDLFEGNVHDLLAACSVTVSANSAVAIEGFLHEKPAILFGASDFDGLVTRAASAQAFAAALQQALSTEWKYRKMLYWYFKTRTIELGAPQFEDQLAAALALGLRR